MKRQRICSLQVLALSVALLFALSGCGAEKGTASSETGNAQDVSSAASEAASSQASSTTSEKANSAEKTVAPREVSLNLSNLPDGSYPAGFTVQDLKTDNNASTLSCQIFAMDIYDAAQVKALAPGDTLVVSGEKITVSKVETNESGAVLVNGGEVDAGGNQLILTEDGNYRISELDDYATYTLQGTVQLPLSADMTFTDRSDWEKPEGVVMNAAEFTEKLPTLGNPYFTVANTTVRVQDGKIAEIIRIFTP